jgi:hypothetical protein
MKDGFQHVLDRAREQQADRGEEQHMRNPRQPPASDAPQPRRHQHRHGARGQPFGNALHGQEDGIAADRIVREARGRPIHEILRQHHQQDAHQKGPQIGSQYCHLAVPDTHCHAASRYRLVAVKAKQRRGDKNAKHLHHC